MTAFRNLLLLPVALALLPAQSTFGFDQQDLRTLLETKACIGCDLRDANLAEAQLTDAQLKWSRLQGANLKGANLNGANLIGANLEGAAIEGATLQGARLEGARLLGVALSQVRLAGADLRWADLGHLDIDIDMEHVDLVAVKLDGAWFKNDIRCGGTPERGGWGCAAR